MSKILGSMMLSAAALASPAAMAAGTANAGVVSEYLFRGIEQSVGAAVQGGLDFTTGGGLYAGTWVSNIAPAGGFGSYETDFYGGFAMSFGDVGFDVGGIYYYYRDATAFNTLEGYIGATFGPFAVKAFYTPEYFGQVDGSGDDADGLYVTASASIALKETLTLTPQVGFSSGDGPKALFADDYMDYSLTLAKTLDNGFSFSVAVVGTDLDTAVVTADDEKVVVGLKKTFDL